MATVSTVTAVWSGFTGAPGYSRFNFFELADAAACNAAGSAVRGLFAGITAYLLSTWTISVQATVQHRDVATGALTGETAMTTVPGNVPGVAAAASAYAGGSGAVVDWITGQFWNGRKVRGRTFLVPLALAFSNDGTISTTFQNACTSAANGLVADPTTTLGVWAKKFDDSDPPKQVAGALFSVTGPLIPDRSAQLRTRRS